MTTDPSTTAAGPTPGELRRRQNLPRQFLRFIVLNVKILKLSRQHH